MKSEKANPNTFSVVKEDRETFGAILGTNTDLSEALKYPITTASLTKANLDHTLRKGSKSNLRNFIVDESKAIQVVPRRDMRCIFDTMSIMKSLKAFKRV